MTIEKQQPNKWYFKTSILIVAFILLGPLALPLLLRNPRFSLKTKIIVSVITVILTYYLMLSLANSLKSLTGYYQQVDQLKF